MRIKEMTTQHLKNRIAYFERFLATKPMDSVYTGDSQFGEDAVEHENRHNDLLAQDIEEHLIEMRAELLTRKELSE